MSRKVVAAVALLVAAAVVAQFGFFFFRDNLSTHYPDKFLSARAFRSLEIPWWNFHDAGGQPLAANPNALTFYPDNVLYLFLPAHVAFSLHFLLHLAAAWLAMRALSRSRFAATVYVLSGVVISATAFYNLVTATALIPLALVGAERRSPRILGIAFGLMLLAAEPVTFVATALAVLILWSGGLLARRTSMTGGLRARRSTVLLAIAIALAIGAPQLIAFSEIASEVERALPSSARTVLNTSLDAKRVAEIFVWPVSGFLNDPGGNRQRLFSTLFLGIIAIPALWRRSRYTLVAAVMLFFAIGEFNPIVAFCVERFELVRHMRYPEKFALPLVVALVMLVAMFYERSSHKRVWLVVTIVPLLWTTWRALPIDWFAPYRVEPVAPRRVHIEADIVPGSMAARDEYRLRAQRNQPIFGAVAGLRYTILRSGDRMSSTLSRIVVDRFRFARDRYLAVALGPDARVVPRAIGSRGIDEAISRFERGAEVAPMDFVSAPARVVAYRERGQRIEIDVEARGPALVLVNQSYFRAWVASLDGEELDTVPVDVDRLGVIVPRSGRIELTFGRHHALIAVTWLLSLVLLVGATLIEKFDRGAGEVERSADEH